MPPPLGLTARCKVIEIVDGDTLTVEVRTVARVRLLDCWAPEVRTADVEEKLRGLAARRFLDEVAVGRHGVLQIQSDHAVDRLDDLFTFGRVLGRVWVGDRELSELMVSEGWATKTK